jgi:hypothetical protein
MMKKILLSIAIILAFSFVGHSQCTHTIALTDTWGDGWNGGTVTVSVNGTPVLTNIALLAGAGPQNHTFTASTGDNINVTRTAPGLYPTEMRVRVYSAAGDIIPLQEPLATPGINGTANCSAPPPGCNTGASYSSYTPLCSGSQENYASGTWAGEYNTLTLTAGVAYTFGAVSPRIILPLQTLQMSFLLPEPNRLTLPPLLQEHTECIFIPIHPAGPQAFQELHGYNVGQFCLPDAIPALPFQVTHLFVQDLRKTMPQAHGLGNTIP